MPKKVGSVDFSAACKQLLDEFGSEVVDILKKAVPDAADHAVNEIRAHSKQDTGRYVKGWSKKEQFARGQGVSFVVYNKDRYRVAHLLENPHTIANKYGKYGMTKGDGVIAAAEEEAEKWLVNEVTKQLGGQG